MLYRAVAKVLHHLPARDLVCVITPLSASSSRRRALMGRLVVRKDQPLKPETHWTAPWIADSHRRNPAIHMFEGNPFAIWNTLCLGPWIEFNWKRLIQEDFPGRSSRGEG